MKYFTLLLIGVISVSNSWSQQTIFSEVLYDSINQIQGYALSKGIDNGFVVAGSYNPDALILKTDDAGNIIWKKKLSFNTGRIFDTYFNDCIITYDSCYLFSGTSRRKGIYVKTDVNGDTLWTKTIAASEAIVINSTLQTSDSGFVLAGSYFASKYFFIVKLDKNGTIEWGKKYAPVDDNLIKGISIKQLGNDSYVLVGQLNNFPAPSFLIHISSKGDIIGGKEYVNPGNHFNPFIDDVLVSDTGFVLLSYLYNHEVCLIATDTTGIIKWTRGYGDIAFGYMENYFHSKVHRTNDNGFLLVGRSSELRWNMLLRTDYAGNAILSETVWLDAVDVLTTDDNGYIVMGNGPVWSGKRFDSFSQIGLIRLDADGNGQTCLYPKSVIYYQHNFIALNKEFEVHNFDLSINNPPVQIEAPRILIKKDTCVNTIGGVDENSSMNIINIYPNPSSGRITVSLLAGEEGQLKIYNIKGQEILDKRLEEAQTEINLSGQIPGVYFYRFMNYNRKVFSGKVVLK